MKPSFVSVIFLILASARLFAQDSAEIRFENNLTWSEVQAKAKAASKPIFLDCYASWCGPCKEMDATVFSDSQVGAYFNEHFICFRMQMDAAANTSSPGMVSQADALALARTYNVNAYPTFLFFSAEGKALHKAVGSRSAKDLLALAREASDPSQQYYTRLVEYRANRDYLSAPKLVSQVRAIDGSAASDAIAFDYIDTYLAHLPESELTTVENLQFLSGYVNRGNASLSSSGAIFRILYGFAGITAKVTGRQKLAQEIVGNVIIAEEIDAKVYTGVGRNRRPLVADPDWDALARVIGTKYGSYYSERLIPRCRGSWFRKFKKNYNAAARCYLDWMEKDGVVIASGAESAASYFNEIIWDYIFELCTDPVELERAARLAKRIASENQDDPNFADTVANLIYKCGHTQEAVRLESEVVAHEDARAAEQSLKAGRTIEPNEDYRANLTKMRKGIPTWRASEGS